MKQGKRPTKEQKIFLASKGLNSENWLISKNTNLSMVIIHRKSGNLKFLKKEET